MDENTEKHLRVNKTNWKIAWEYSLFKLSATAGNVHVRRGER